MFYQWALENVRQYDSFVVTRESPVIAIVSAIQDAGLEIGKDLDLVIKYSSSLPFYLRQPMMACFEDLRLAGKTLGQSMLAHFARPGISQAKVLLAPPPGGVCVAPRGFLWFFFFEPLLVGGLWYL